MNDWDLAVSELEMAVRRRTARGSSFTGDELLALRVLVEDDSFGPVSVQEIARQFNVETAELARRPT